MKMLVGVGKIMRLTDLMAVPFEKHLLVNFLLRLILIAFSVLQDRISEVPYTDIDYRVVADGARHVLNNESPFRRHTYRYSPFLAYLMIPNLIFHESVGKIIFSLCDILSSVLVRNIVYVRLEEICTEATKKSGEHDRQPTLLGLPHKLRKWSEFAAYMLLYNPIGMVISSRGSNDAVSNLLILLTFYNIQKSSCSLKNAVYAGIFHGLAIHFRIFPIIFSLAYYLSISKGTCIWRALLVPNKKQLALAFVTIASFTVVTYLFYTLYGFEYLHEAYFHHFSRVDIRHNFSLYYLMQYLNSNTTQNLFEKLMIFLPRVIILLYLSVTFGRTRKTLAFCVFAQTFVFVAYNTVVTSQYFVWYLTLLPLSYPNLRHLTPRFIATISFWWLLAQALWLLFAYLLEFQSWNTYNWIGFHSMVFFLTNVYVLKRLIDNFRCLSPKELVCE